MKKIINIDTLRPQSWEMNEEPYYLMLELLLKGKTGVDEISEVLNNFDNSHTKYLISEQGYLSPFVSDLSEIYEEEQKNGLKGFLSKSFELLKHNFYDFIDEEDMLLFDVNSIALKIPNSNLNNFSNKYLEFLLLLGKEYEKSAPYTNENIVSEWVRAKEEFEESHTLLMIKELGENSPPVYILYDLFMHERLEGPFSFIYHVLKYYQEIE